MEIKPINIFTKDGYKNATWLHVRGVGDNYKDVCHNFYELCEVVTEEVKKEVDGEQITETVTQYVPVFSDNCTVDGEDYENWDNSNEQIVEIVARKIGVEII